MDWESQKRGEYKCNLKSFKISKLQEFNFNWTGGSLFKFKQVIVIVIETTKVYVVNLPMAQL